MPPSFFPPAAGAHLVAGFMMAKTRPERKMIVLSPAMSAAERMYDARALVGSVEGANSDTKNWQIQITSAIDDAIIFMHEAGIPITELPQDD